MKFKKNKEQLNLTISDIRIVLKNYADFITVLDVALCSIQNLENENVKKCLLPILIQKSRNQEKELKALFIELEQLLK